MAKVRPGGGLVYASGQGRMCPRCERPLAHCACRTQRTDTTAPAAGAVVRIGRETQGRKGKGVTVVQGIPLRGAELEDLASELKRRCGSGGTLKNGVIEIQGDHRDTLLDALAGRGWTLKRSGG